MHTHTHTHTHTGGGCSELAYYVSLTVDLQLIEYSVVKEERLE